MRILFICADVPSRRRIRAHGMLSALAGRGHQITVVCGAAPGSQRAIAELRARGLQVVAEPQSVAGRRWNALRAAPGPLPMRAAAAFGPRLLGAAREESRSGAYDIAHVDGISASALGCALIGMPAIIDAATCASLALAHRSRDTWRDAAWIAPELARTRRHEATYIQSYEHVIAASAEDAWALGAISGASAALSANIHSVPTAIPVERSPGLLTLREQGTLLLCAAPEGREAIIRQVVAAVMPQIWSQRADIKLLVAGPLPARLGRGGAADPRILSVSADDRRAAARATLALAPGDAQAAGEALLAMGAGAPLVASLSIGRHLGANGGRDLLLADGPGELAQAALDMLDDPRYRGQIGRSGRAYVERQHSPAAVADALERVYAAARGASIADWSLDMGLGLLNSREVGRVGTP